MQFMVLNMDRTVGTHNHMPLALARRPLYQKIKDLKKNFSNTVSAISYCNGTLYKGTIRHRNTWLIYKKLLKAMRKLESNFNLCKSPEQLFRITHRTKVYISWQYHCNTSLVYLSRSII